MKITLELGKVRAGCLECDFKLGLSPKPQHVNYNAEMHGRLVLNHPHVRCHE